MPDARTNIISEDAAVAELTLYDDLANDEIRLIELLPGEPESQIECRLSKATLETRPAYEALSYVWGDATSTETILCNGQLLEVTTNLAKALRRLRPRSSSNSSRVLWADAICIQQSNAAEKNMQVPLMTKIYSFATKVVVWMGLEDSETVATALAVIEYVNSVYIPPVASDILVLSKVDAYAHEKGLHNVWGALHTFFSVPYWTRIWCVQEVNLARETLLFVGSKDIAETTVTSFTQWYLRSVSESIIRGGGYEDGENRSEAIFQADVMLSIGMWRLSDNESIYEVLDVFRFARATDLRDKVYALLGLFEKMYTSRYPIEVDYGKTVVDVYTDVALLSVTRTRDLNVLSYIDHGRHYDASSEFPSWVPRWDCPRMRGQLCMLKRRTLLSAGRHKAEIIHKPSISRFFLCLHGISFDHAVTRSTILPGATHLEQDEEFVQLLSHLWSEVKSTEQDFPHHISDIELAMTLTGGLTVNDRAIPTPEDADEYYQSFETMEIVDSLTGYQYLADFNNFLQMLHISDSDDEDVTEGGRSFALVAGTACCTRRVFRTSRGYLGLGPACMKEGDVVVVLDGGKVPYILRPLADSTYAFMSECFVYAIRNGEAYDMLGTDGVERRQFELL